MTFRDSFEALHRFSSDEGYSSLSESADPSESAATMGKFPEGPITSKSPSIDLGLIVKGSLYSTSSENSMLKRATQCSTSTVDTMETFIQHNLPAYSEYDLHCRMGARTPERPQSCSTFGLREFFEVDHTECPQMDALPSDDQYFGSERYSADDCGTASLRAVSWEDRQVAGDCPATPPITSHEVELQIVNGVASSSEPVLAKIPPNQSQWATLVRASRRRLARSPIRLFSNRVSSKALVVEDGAERNCLE